jgi:membrane protein DedA with SNARE-associated domain
VLESLVEALGSSSVMALFGPFVVLLLCGVGLPVPEDIVLIAAGFLCARESLPVLPVAMLMYFGILLGDSITFFLGSKVGFRLLKTKFGARFIGQSSVDRASAYLSRWGTPLLFAARFMPGLRAPIYFTSGALGFRYISFLLVDAFAAVISAPVFVWLGHWGYRRFQDDLSQLESSLAHWKPYILAGAIIILVTTLLILTFRRRSLPTKEPQHEKL